MMAHDNEILTAYLDGELEPQERREVEARLEAQPELRQQLEALRAASKAVQNLPRKKAPASILAAVRGEIAQAGEGKGQVIRAGEQFKPAARPNPWRTRLISMAALLAVGVMIFVAVKASLLHESKEMTAQAPKKEPAAVAQSQQAKEKRALLEKGKANGAKHDAPEAREESDAMDVVAADSALPAAEPPAETRPLKVQPYASGKPAEMEQNGGTADRFRAAAEKAPELAKAEATGGGEAKELQRGKAAPAEAGTPGGFGGTQGAGAGNPARTLDEAKVTTRELAEAKEREGAVAQKLETGAADMPKPAAPPSPPAAAAKAEQQLAQAGPPPAPPTAMPREDASAEGGEEQEQLAMANAADGKPAGGEANLKSEFKKESKAKDQALAVAADVPAKQAAQVAPTVIRLRAGDPEKARAELLALAAAQGGRELAQNLPADKGNLRRGIGTTTAEADDAQKAGELLVAEAMKKSKAGEPQAVEGALEEERTNKAIEGKKVVEPSAELAAAERKDAKADAEAPEKREAQEQEGTKLKDRAAMDPTAQPKVVRLVLQVPASKKAALLAALQQEANRRRLERQSSQPETLGGGIGHAPEAPKQDRSTLDSGDKPQAKKEDARRVPARQAAQEPRPNEDPAAPAAAAPAEVLEIIEVLIELVP